ncbi:MAG: hypothetical protein ACKVZ6_06700, partial [Kineosporiaceae bacterium]
DAGRAAKAPAARPGNRSAGDRGTGERGAAERGAGRQPVRLTAPRDEEASFDDPDVEDSSLVGAPVVEQLLGGKVIEDREE